MKWWFLILGIALLQMSVFIEVTEAKARDSDGDGTPDIGRQIWNYIQGAATKLLPLQGVDHIKK